MLEETVVGTCACGESFTVSYSSVFGDSLSPFALRLMHRKTALGYVSQSVVEAKPPSTVSNILMDRARRSLKRMVIDLKSYDETAKGLLDVTEHCNLPTRFVS